MTKRLFAALAATAVLTTSLVLTAGAVANKPAGKSDSGTAYFAITHTVGKTEYAAGQGTDKILGPAAATYKIAAGAGSAPGTVKVTVKPVTLYMSTGSLVGTSSATLTISSNGTETITNGKLKLTKGFGSQKGHSLTATYTGSSLSATSFVIHYKGTYK
jgi:hypothetical protein